MCDKSTLVSDVSQNSDVAPAGDALVTPLPILFFHRCRFILLLDVQIL
jgi:hypothetical protein